MNKATKSKKIIYILLTAAAIALRIAFFSYETPDYTDFLSKWVQYFRDNGGFAALKDSIGNYNIPYLYFLALFSYIPVNDLYLIKILSCCFDFLLARSCSRIAEHCGGRGDIAFFAVLFLPTVVINGALWAQCDSIYTALALTGLALALNPKPKKYAPVVSMTMFALSFGFKLQAVFILPVCVILLIAGRYRLWHFLVFPLTYVITILPAVILGRPFKDALLLYFNQAESVGTAPNYNAPSLTALDQSVSGNALIILAFAAMVILFAVAVIFRRRLSNRVILTLSVLMVTIIPFLLPHMHDRYFFAADVLTVALACCTAVAAVSALLQQFASLICYLAYLKTYYLPLGNIYLTNDRGAVAVIIAMAIEIFILSEDLSTAPRQRRRIHG